MTTVLAIDQGTSGTKAVVVDAHGRTLGAAERPVKPTYGPHGAVEQEPHALLESVLEAGREAISRAGSASVDVVALANQGETVLAWDPRSGEPLSTMISWQDRRASVITEDLADHRDLIAARTGLVLDPYFSAPKLAWLRKNVTRAGVVSTSDTWMIRQLTGEFVTDAATASRSLVLDLDTGTWDGELLEIFGLGGEAMPEVVPCDAVVGTTEAFGSRIPVGGLVVDQQAALIAQQCLEPGRAKCTFGTGAFLLANVGSTAIRSATGMSTSIAWLAKNQLTYCLDGQVYAAAAAVGWLQRLGIIDEATDLDRLALPDSGGVIAVPALAGLAAPRWRPDATASISGMTLATERGHIIRAVLEGIAAQVAEIAQAVERELSLQLETLRVDGGLTKSAALMQCVADVLQTVVEVYPGQDATALGAAALGRAAVDGVSLEDSVIPWEPAARYDPRWSAAEAGDFLERWGASASAAP